MYNKFDIRQTSLIKSEEGDDDALNKRPQLGYTSIMNINLSMVCKNYV